MTKKGNILLVANWESDVGFAWWLMENFWVTISTHFSKDGMACYLIYPLVTRIPKTIRASEIEVLECDFQDHSLRNLNSIRKFIRSKSIQYLYLTDSPAYSLFYILIRLWGVKKIVVHDHTPGERTMPGFTKYVLKCIVQRIPFFTADHFISVTQFVHNRHTKISCIPENKCSIATNGIQPINLEDSDSHYAYREFAIPEQRTIIVTTGRASYYKGIDFFIECACELINNQGYSNLHFLFCGDGPDLDDFRLKAREMGIDKNFTFAGKRSDIRNILPSCSIGFHAAKGEVGYSLSILEYMSAGLVTVVPDGPSTALATIDMENGIKYQPDNLESASNAILTALDPVTGKRIRENGIRSVTDTFNLNRTNTELLESLDSVFC